MSETHCLINLISETPAHSELLTFLCHKNPPQPSFTKEDRGGFS
jgi:hypothetical protein